MKMKIAFVCLLSVVSATLFAQRTVLEQEFMHPPVAKRPFVWWHWMGSNFSKAGITKDLEAMKASGIGGATIFNITSAVQESHVPTLNNPWPQQTYRSEAYWDAMQHAAKEAKRLGLEIGLQNSPGYSTTGGPWIDEAHSMKKLVFSSRVIASNETGVSIAKPAPVVDMEGWGRRGLPPVPSTWYKDIAYLAIPAADSLRYTECADVSSHFDTTGKLIKALPEGVWLVYRVGYAPTMSTPHPLPDDLINKCLEADKMSVANSHYHWRQVLDPLTKYVGAYFNSSFRHVLIDSYEAGDQNWTDDFRKAFLQRKNYDPLPWLLTVAQTAGGKHPVSFDSLSTARFQYDFYDVIHQLFQQNGWMVGKQALKKHGLQFQFEPYEGPFNTASGTALADLPMGEFWSYQTGAIHPHVVAAAAASGKNVVGAEALTGAPDVSKYNEDPEYLLKATTGAFASGVNKLMLHTWVHQPFDDAFQPGLSMGWWGSHFGRHQTWFKESRAFMDYLARVQVMMQYGNTTGDYLCVESLQGDGDLISKDDFLRSNITVRNKKIVLPSGKQYAFVVFPASDKMLPELLTKLQALLQQGAVIVAQKPVASPSMMHYPACDKQVQQLSAAIWSNAIYKNQLFGSIDAAKAQCKWQPAVSVVQADSSAAIKTRYRRHGNEHTFLVASTGLAQQVTLQFAVTGLQPELFDPVDGTVHAIPVFTQNNSYTALTLSLQPYAIQFVVFRAKSPAFHVLRAESSVKTNVIYAGNRAFLVAEAAGKIALPAMDRKASVYTLQQPDTISISSSWNVLMQPKLDTAFTVTMPALQDFSKSNDDRIKYFAGTAVYNTHVNISKQSNRQVVLQLGNVNDIATVRINNGKSTVLWFPPYETDITEALKEGDNLFEISVTNNWANRIIGDEQVAPDFEWGSDRGGLGRAIKAYPDWFVKKQPRPSARKTFLVWNYYRKDSPLQAAGLVGPVRLISRQMVPL